jgi:hypothetical protein
VEVEPLLMMLIDVVVNVEQIIDVDRENV